ncbi:hypothetical protein [Leucobacter celer]|jgi:hypothetical protein|uniref:hypothetical protein n=1 Tax=Leucobacter celer TaxID=668625 RepID=UPI0006A78C41|nr:hypothetical protein [Leucobacter celer]
MENNITPLHEQRRVRPLRTPYHSLGDGHEMIVPDWAQHRSVYRTSGRTLYLVETESLDEALGDLERLGRAGWDVRVDEDPAAPGSRARIALSRRDLAKAA